MENHPLFIRIVEHLEKHENGAALELLKETDRRTKESLVVEKDWRGDIISEYCYRYRPQLREGFTLLHYAMIYGNPQVVSELLKLGADPSMKSDRAGERYNVLHIPCFLGNFDNVKTLLEYSSVPEETKVWLVNDPYNHVYEDGSHGELTWTPLHYACGGNNKEMIKLLLSNGADPLNQDSLVLTYASRVSHSDIVLMLLKACRCKGQELVGLLSRKDEYQRTSLHYASMSKNTETLAILLEKKADPLVIDGEGKTPLHYAITHGSDDCASMLLDEMSNCYLIENFLNSEVLQEMIDGELTKTFVKLLEMYRPAYRMKQFDCILHKVITSDAFSDKDFADIVWSLGKNCIEEEDDEKMTCMLLAASKNMHKKLGIIFGLYMELLEQNMFFSEKPLYKHLYCNIVGGKNKQGLAMAHLVVMCNGSDSDFEETVQVLNGIWKKLTSLKGSKDWWRDEKDPFLVSTLYKGQYLSAMELAFQIHKPERALHILEVTEARTLESVDKWILNVALRNSIQSADFERMTSSILNFAKQKSFLISLGSLRKFYVDELVAVRRLFNTAENGDVPLHQALRRKSFSHATVLLQLKEADCHIVEVVIDSENSDNSTLHIALVNSAPSALIVLIMDRLQLEKFPVVEVPLEKGVHACAIDNVFSTTPDPNDEAFKRKFWEKVLKDAVKKKRHDVFEMVTTKYGLVFPSVLKELIFNKQKEEFALTAVRYSEVEMLKEALTSVVKTPSDNYTTPFNEITTRMPDVAQEALNRCVSEEGVPDTRLLLQSKKSTNDIDGFQFFDGLELPKVKIAHPLDIMVQQKQDKLLQHPLVKHYLNRQWRTYGFWAYCLQILLYMIFLGSLSALVQTIQHPVEDSCSTFQIGSSATLTKGQKTTIVLSGVCILALLLHSGYAMFITLVFRRQTVYHIRKLCTCRGGTRMDTMLNVIKNTLLFAKKLFRLQMLVFLTSMAFLTISVLYTSYGACHTRYTWRLGIFTVIFGWTNLITTASKFPIIGEYALVFKAICVTFLKVALFGILLVLASVLVLDMIFYNPLVPPNSPYATFGGSIVNLITMVTGELDFHNTFGFSFDFSDEVTHEIYDRRMAYFIWVIFLILVPILLSNTLTALAVGDVSEVQKDATFRNLKLKVYWVTGLRHFTCNNYCLKFLMYLSDFLASFSEDESKIKKELDDVKAYYKQWKDDKRTIEDKYTASSGGTECEYMRAIKDVTKGNRNKLRDLKVSHDHALHRLHIGQDHLRKDILSDLFDILKVIYDTDIEDTRKSALAKKKISSSSWDLFCS